MHTAKPCAIVPLRDRAGAAADHAAELPIDLTTGSVALDIGDDAGALVIHTDADRLGDEIEIEPLSPERPRRHVAVLARRVAGHTAYAAVFGDLLAGAYRVPIAGKPTSTTIEINPGEISEIDQRNR